jgi:hypothetical protein
MRFVDQEQAISVAEFEELLFERSQLSSSQ